MKLSEPAVFPWASGPWEPIRLGPAWRAVGGVWVLPDATIGWDVLGWCGTELQLRRQPWRFTLEQARWILWWFSVDEFGEWLFTDGVLQRLKGWGKDPLAACLLYAEAFGPCRVAEMVHDQPIATDCPEAWVQTAATALQQTKNTMRLMPALATPSARAKYRMQIGKETIYGLGDERLIEAVTSSPATLEGARATFVLKNETQHWLATNNGHDMADVIERNATKSEGGAARTLAITNAYAPGQDSVAERDRDAYELAESGGSLTTGILYDTLEAPEEAPLTAEDAPAVIEAIRGDSEWLSTKRIVKSILDTRNPASRSRRWWYNSKTATEDQWVSDPEVAGVLRPNVEVADGDTIVLGFDGSRKRSKTVTDATALIGCRVSDGHVFQVRVWEQPEGVIGTNWQVPAIEVDGAVHDAFQRWNVVGFYCDPAKWESYIASWEAKYHDRLKVKASQNHPCEWWMTGGRTLAIVRATEQFKTAVTDKVLTLDGSFALTRHLLNARMRSSKQGIQIHKEHPDSHRKIDAAVAAILAWQARLDALAKGVGNEVETFVPFRVR